jgi:hypothetical protein
VIGRLVCLIYAHKWAHLYENRGNIAVFGCLRCRKVEAAR